MVNHNDASAKNEVNYNLNTSYVMVNLIVINYIIPLFAFKYILCYG